MHDPPLLLLGLFARPNASPVSPGHIALPSVDEWISTTQAVKILDVTPSTLYRLIDDGKLRAYRFGRVIRIRKRDLEAFVESSSVERRKGTYQRSDDSREP